MRLFVLRPFTVLLFLLTAKPNLANERTGTTIVVLQGTRTVDASRLFPRGWRIQSTKLFRLVNLWCLCWCNFDRGRSLHTRRWRYRRAKPLIDFSFSVVVPGVSV